MTEKHKLKKFKVTKRICFRALFITMREGRNLELCRMLIYTDSISLAKERGSYSNKSE